MFMQLKRYGWLIGLLGWLVACGQANVPATSTPPSTPPPVSLPTGEQPTVESRLTVGATAELPDIVVTMPAIPPDFPNLPQVQAVELPTSWQTAQTITSTAQLTAEIMQTVISQSPELLNDLSPEMWRALPIAALEPTLPALPADFDPVLKSQLQLILAIGLGQKPPAQPLPTAWVAAASYVGLDATTTDQMTSAAFIQIRAGTPELLDTLTDEIVLGFPIEVLALLPPELLTQLHPDTQQTIEIAILRAVGQ